MSIVRLRLAMFSSLVLLLPVTASAQPANTTSANATSLMVGTEAEGSYGAFPFDNAWYITRVVAGRSYCAETTTGLSETRRVDTVLNVYAQDFSVIGNNNDAVTEPAAFLGSRVCFVWHLDNGFVFLSVGPQVGITANTFQAFRIRIVETTLFNPYFYSVQDYNSWTLCRNITNASLNATFTWRTPDATDVYIRWIVLLTPGVQASFEPRLSFTRQSPMNGSIDIAHDGPPQALACTQSTFSAATGVSIDSPFIQRVPW